MSLCGCVCGKRAEKSDRGGWHWCGLVRRGAGKLICWIGSEVLIDQWHTWLHTLHSASLKLSVSPLRETVCCCLKRRSIQIKSTTHAHFKRSLQTKRRRSVAEKKTKVGKGFQRNVLFQSVTCVRWCKWVICLSRNSYILDAHAKMQNQYRVHMVSKQDHTSE